MRLWCPCKPSGWSAYLRPPRAVTDSGNGHPVIAGNNFKVRAGRCLWVVFPGAYARLNPPCADQHRLVQHRASSLDLGTPCPSCRIPRACPQNFSGGIVGWLLNLLHNLISNLVSGQIESKLPGVRSRIGGRGGSKSGLKSAAVSCRVSPPPPLRRSSAASSRAASTRSSQRLRSTCPSPSRPRTTSPRCATA